MAAARTRAAAECRLAAVPKSDSRGSFLRRPDGLRFRTRSTTPAASSSCSAIDVDKLHRARAPSCARRGRGRARTPAGIGEARREEKKRAARWLTARSRREAPDPPCPGRPLPLPRQTQLQQRAVDALARLQPFHAGARRTTALRRTSPTPSSLSAHAIRLAPLAVVKTTNQESASSLLPRACSLVSRSQSLRAVGVAGDIPSPRLRTQPVAALRLPGCSGTRGRVERNTHSYFLRP
jgi:hypothetical protein